MEGTTSQGSAIFEAPPKVRPLGLASPTLALSAEVLDDLERTRIANENRLRQLTRDVPDKDGEERGFGLDESNPAVARLAGIVAGLLTLEEQATLNLKREMRAHPLGQWVKAQVGVGDKQAARLLAAIGDPYWNTLHGRPRTVSELWAYSGLHVLPAGQTSIDTQVVVAGGEQSCDPGHRQTGTQGLHAGVAAARRRGQQANWSAAAKMRSYLIAVSCVQQRPGTPWREFYVSARAKYEDAVHTAPCTRCGPAGHPALPGSPLSAGHQHARALRLLSKELLKEMWRESKRIHELNDLTGETP